MVANKKQTTLADKIFNAAITAGIAVSTVGMGSAILNNNLVHAIFGAGSGLTVLIGGAATSKGVREYQAMQQKLQQLETRANSAEARATSALQGLEAYQSTDPIHHMNTVVMPLDREAQQRFDAFQDSLAERNFAVSTMQNLITNRQMAFASISTTSALSVNDFVENPVEVSVNEQIEAEAEA